MLDVVSRVTVRNFTIDWPNLQAAAVGTVMAVGGNANSGYTYNLQVPVANIVKDFSVFTAWDSVNNYWSLTKHDEVYYSNSYNFSGTGLATNLPGTSQLTVGESLLVRHVGTHHAVTILESQDVTMDSVTVYSSPDVGFLVDYGRGLHLTNCHVDRSGNRPISTIADAVHFVSYGGDVIIENSSFAYQGDDGLNLRTVMAPGGFSALVRADIQQLPDFAVDKLFHR